MTTTMRRSRPRPASPRPRKSMIGNVILSTAFAIVFLVVVQNFRVLSGLQQEQDTAVDKGDKRLAFSAPQQQSQQRQQEYNTPPPLDDDSIKTFVVWTFPSAPDDLPTTPLNDDQVLLCSYPPCGSTSQRLNLLELTQNTSFATFIQQHANYKVQQYKDYLFHIQSVALLSLVQRYPTKCAKTWGADETICADDLPTYAHYDPTAPSPKLPFEKDSLPSFSLTKFNVLSYDSKIKLLKEANLEDELQTLAAAQFLPQVTNFVDRDTGLQKVDGHLLCNARFRSSFKLPSKTLTDIWDTTFSSIQLRYDAKKTIKDHAWLFKEYNSQHGAVGAEDESTLEYLQELDIDSYLALSFNLMTFLPPPDKNHTTTARNSTIIWDVKPGLLPPHVEETAVSLPRTVKQPVRWKRLKQANDMVKTVSNTAQVVITSRIQLGLPVIAMGIPVIYVGMKDYLVSNGVQDMFHTFDPYNGDTWKFDVNKLQPLPGLHRADRSRASFWNVLKRSSSYYTNTAYLYGLVPMQRFGRQVDEKGRLHDLFHFIFTTAPETLTWREKRAMEHVFYFHPNAQVIVHSNTLKPGDASGLDVFVESGYDLSIQPYDLPDLLKRTITSDSHLLVDTFISQLPEFAKGEHWYSHETDILRYLLLWNDGGVYLDTDMYLIQSLQKAKLENAVAYQDPQHDFVSGAVMIFEPGHSLLQAALQWTLEQYALRRNEWPILGSTLMTQLASSSKDDIKATFTVLDDASFYPIGYESIDTCFTQELSTLGLGKTYGVHLNAKLTSHYTTTTKGTFCDRLLHTYCIFCDEIHSVPRFEGVVLEPGDGGGNDHHVLEFVSPDDNDKQHAPTKTKQQVNTRKPSFFSRVASSWFGGGSSQTKQAAAAKPALERKALPPIHMEFVKKDS